jgi:hypothetical protein
MILEGASIRLAKHLEQKTLRAAVVQECGTDERAAL